MANPTTSDYARGALYGLAAVCIWAGFIVVSRLGVRSSLTPWDVAAIRFAVAGLLLLPYAMRKGLALDRLGWVGVGAIVELVNPRGAPLRAWVRAISDGDPGGAAMAPAAIHMLGLVEGGETDIRALHSGVLTTEP